MSETKLTVKVSGPVGSGKSAICGEIEIAMKAIGVPVEWRDGDSEKRLTHADWARDLDLYKPSVAICEENPAMERERICRAAEAANAAFGQARAEAMRLIIAEETRQAKLHDLLETIREQIRLGVAPEHRPDGLFKNIQDAVYAMRGRTPLMHDAAVTSVVQSGLSADWIAMIITENARVENGSLANGPYLAVKIAEASDNIEGSGPNLADAISNPAPKEPS